MIIYKIAGESDDADCLIVPAFGTSTDAGSVNHQLAMFALAAADGRPILADLAIAESVPEHSRKIAYVMKGESATYAKIRGKIPHVTVGGDGTWGSLVRANRYMADHALNRAMMVAQAWHVNRVAKQASKLGLSSIMPTGLPKKFDRRSHQFWTRSVILWLPVNAAGSLLLKWRGQL